MTIRHHPEDDLLLALAAGTLAVGPELVVRAHLEGCPACRMRMQGLEDVGGVLLEQTKPAPLATGAWSGTLKRIAEGPAQATPSAGAAAAVVAHRTGLSAASPAALCLPPTWPGRALRGCTTTGWHWAGPGMSYARLSAPPDPRAKLFLLRIGPGRGLARHSHAGIELTQVLSGRFEDGRSAFAAGDFDAADGSVCHEPHVSETAPCICLASVEGSLRFVSRLGRAVGRWLGL